ncbi:MAG: DUF6268 family outer membrane beta-barrel protein [Candidatus Omnitrophota bacterium]|nr:DUF6268 family outer membrane beta-barrel protein [Candidatus Omnitrophota bacterium]
MVLKNARVVFYLCTVFIFLSCSALIAQTADKPQGESSTKTVQDAGEDFRQRLHKKITVTEDEYAFGWDSSVIYAPGKSLRAQPGKVSILDTESELSYEFKVLGGIPIELSLNTEYINIAKNSSLPIYLPAQLTSYGFGAEVTLPFFNLKDTYLRAKLVPSFFTDHWGATSNSFRLPAQLFLIYRPSEKLIFIAGVASDPGTENGSILPIAGLIYQPDNKWTFNLVGERPSITYAITERLSAFVDGGLSDTEFKISRTEFRGKTLAYKEVHYGGGLQYQVNKNLEAYLSCGRMANRSLKYRDSLGKVGIKDSIYTQLRLEADF